MSSSLTPEEVSGFTRLMQKIAIDDNGFIPDQVSYELVHKLVPWPAVEVLPYRSKVDGTTFGTPEFLLSYRKDCFTGWHIPGGFMRAKETYQMACDRNVKKEKIAEGVTNIQLIGTKVWTEGHPFGYPISLIIACNAVGDVVERGDINDPQPGDLHWFSEIPDNIIPEYHPDFPTKLLSLACESSSAGSTDFLIAFHSNHKRLSSPQSLTVFFISDNSEKYATTFTLLPRVALSSLQHGLCIQGCLWRYFSAPE